MASLKSTPTNAKGGSPVDLNVSRETLKRSLALVGKAFRPLTAVAQASSTHLCLRAPPACFARNIEQNVDKDNVSYEIQ